jgi:SAM-dependent MidA family methyltransferase
MGPVSDDLGARLRRRIEDAGPITFAEFMESALYDPDGGFFERGGSGESGGGGGPNGDFVTSPHVSPLFGSLLSRLVEDVRTRLGNPDPFRVVEVGAGDGTLARALADGLAVTGPAELVLVERTARHRKSLASLAGSLPTPARVVATISELEPGSVTGCVLANEVLDNLPFRRVRRGPHGPVELCVGVEDGALTLVELPPSSPETSAAARHLPEGGEALVPTGTYELLAGVGAALERGFVVMIDYAAAAGDAEVHGYRMHRPVADVLAGAGTSDVTAGVDFGDVARFAEGSGFRSWGSVTQRDLLLSLGYREEMDRLLARQGDLLNEGRGTEAARVFSERGRATLLVDEGGLGGFRALCLGKGVSSPPGPWG